MTNLNKHLNPQRLSFSSKRDYELKTDQDIQDFSDWLEVQTEKFGSVQEALEVYRNGTSVQSETETKVVTTKKTYIQSDFKSRQQLNSFLRRNGYTWHKIAPMNEAEESQYGESYRWQLFCISIV